MTDLDKLIGRVERLEEVTRDLTEMTMGLTLKAFGDAEAQDDMRRFRTLQRGCRTLLSELSLRDDKDGLGDHAYYAHTCLQSWRRQGLLDD